MIKFLIVFESMWNNKNISVATIGNLGDKVVELINANKQNEELKYEIDVEKLNSDNPYDVGTFGLGFNDIEIQEEDEFESYFGRIMIFQIGEL